MLTANIKRTRGLTSVKYKFKTSQEANSTWGRMLKKEMEKLQDRLSGFDDAEAELAAVADEKQAEVEQEPPSMLAGDKEPEADKGPEATVDDGSASTDGLGMRITGAQDAPDNEPEPEAEDEDDNESVTKGFQDTPVAPEYAKTEEPDEDEKEAPETSSDGMGVTITKTGDEKPAEPEAEKPAAKKVARRVPKKKVSVKRGKK